MKTVDCHAHLDDEQFAKDIDKVIQRAKAAGVIAIINNGVCPETNRKTLRLAQTYEIVKPALGLHPTLLQKVCNVEKELSFIKRNKDKIIAIGEIGLDYHWKNDNKHDQKELFLKMLALSEELDLPAIIHTREAEEDVFEIISEFKVKIILHSFEGNKRLIQEGIRLGCYFSIPTKVERSETMQTVVKEVDIEKLLTETDCPYLSSTKNKRNEPAFVMDALKSIAEIKGIDAEKASEIIIKNYEKVFI